MNYRHAFHAGNFADVVKHATLARVIAHLKDKPTAFRIIDTHADRLREYVFRRQRVAQVQHHGRIAQAHLHVQQLAVGAGNLHSGVKAERAHEPCDGVGFVPVRELREDRRLS